MPSVAGVSSAGGAGDGTGATFFPRHVDTLRKRKTAVYPFLASYPPGGTPASVRRDRNASRSTTTIASPLLYRVQSYPRPVRLAEQHSLFVQGPSPYFPRPYQHLHGFTTEPQSYNFVCSLFYVVCILRKIGRSWIFWNEGKRTR